MRNVVAIVVVAWLLAPGAASAFQGGQDFALSASQGGGERRYFTGAPRWKRYDCTICHVKAARKIWVEVTSLPPELFTTRRYEPGRSYRIHVSLEGAHLAGQGKAHRSTFVAELTDDRDAAAGELLADDPQAALAYDEGRVLAAVPIDEKQAWDFTWTAPASGGGPTTLYLGAVEGNGAGDQGAARSDPLGDDVFIGALRLCEGTIACEAAPVAGPARQEGSLQCASSPGSPDGPSNLALLVLAIAMTLRRRWQAGLPLILLLWSCAPHRQTGEEREGPRAQGPCPAGQLCVGTTPPAAPPVDAMSRNDSGDGHGAHADGAPVRDAAGDAPAMSRDARHAADAPAPHDAARDAACMLPDPCSAHRDCERCGPPSPGRFLCCINLRCGEHGVMCP